MHDKRKRLGPGKACETIAPAYVPRAFAAPALHRNSRA